MTDPTPQPRPEEEPNPVGEVFEQLTTAERLVVVGAALVAGLSWLVGDVLFNEYQVAEVGWLLAVGTLVGVYSYFKAAQAPWHSLYPWIVAVAAIAVGLLGLQAFFEDFRAYSRNDITWLFRLGFYAGAGLMAAGGLQLVRTRR